VVGAFEWRLSDRTKKANAALTGLGGTRRVLVSDTLLSGEYSDDEIEVILAHELGHHVHGDIWKGILVDAMLAGAGFFTAHQVLLVAGPVLGLRGIADPAGLPLLVASVAALSQVLLPIDNAVSRERERRADRFALSLTGNAGAFVSAMRRLGAQNLAEDNPSWVVRTLFSSHPPIRERIAAVESPTFSGRSAPPSLPGSRYRSPGYSRTESSPADRL
jgi:STE24 endopeptidase